MSDSELTVLNGTVEEIIFRNDINGYTVIGISSEEELVTAVGVMPDISEGENVRLLGKMEEHRSYGEQFKVEQYTVCMPESTEDIFRYLSSGIVSGIGPKKAMKIIEKFGSETLAVIESYPERLATIRGISQEQAEKISIDYRAKASVRGVILELQKYSLSALDCVKIQKRLGDNAAEIVRENPYTLCSLGIGISFEKALVIESRLEKKPSSDCRIEAGILDILRKHRYSNGHTCVPREMLIEQAAGFLNVSYTEIESTLSKMKETCVIRTESFDDTEFIFLASVHAAESGIARRMAVIMRFPPAFTKTLVTDIERIELEDTIVYEEQQRIAISTAVNKGLLVLTGGPGTGKTTTLKGILGMFEKQKLNIVLAAPTGRAAQRMSEVTGREAKTIHRLLEVEWDENDNPVFRRDAQNPLDCNAVILDELSMVDVSLFDAFLSALPLGCRLVMVGDSDQLPPVGAGNVLRDIIDSKALPVVELKKVFRQSLESAIIRNAHKIVNGEMPELNNAAGTDFFHMERTSPRTTAQTVSELCEIRLPKAYGYSFMKDIQVLCPGKKGECGTKNINALLQSKLNPKAPDKKEIYANGMTFRTGDKVMQIKNNYTLQWIKDDEHGEGIFNGDIGVLTKIDSTSAMLTIDFDGKITDYPEGCLEELELSYAITVHKSQGSEFKAVLLAVMGVNENLAYRNLLYTAVTRAKELLITVGSAAQIAFMTNNAAKTKRYSALRYFLENEVGNPLD